MSRHDHIAGRPRDYISRRWFHRARHRAGESTKSVADITKELDRQLNDAHPSGWHISADGKFFVTNMTMRFPEPFFPAAPSFVMIESPTEVVAGDDCPHIHTDTVNEIEDYYSNGMFGVPASNMPLRSDLVMQTTTCLDCGQELYEGMTEL